MKLVKTIAKPLVTALLLSGFGTFALADVAVVSEAITQSLASTERPEYDIASDSTRLPGEVLAFLEIAPGQDVLDMFSGAGYYAELISRVVGATGTVVAHNNPSYARQSAQKRTPRYADNRLSNVTELIETDEALTLAKDAFDRVVFILAYHDVYYLDNVERGWPKVDRAAMLSKVFQATRQGGIVGVIDHAASPDESAETIADLHRIDPALVERDFIAAGFELIDSSDILANTKDDLSLMAMLPSVRGNTDRFVLKFRKP